MIAVLWALIAISFAFFFIYLCIMATVFLKRQLGLGYAIVFVIGLMSMGSGNNTPKSTVERSSGNSIPNDTTIIGKHNNRLVLEKNLLYKINLHYFYGYDKHTNELLPLYSFSTMTGIISGTRWLHGSSIMISDSTGTKLQYSVSGTLERHLLNIFHYYQEKTYEGTIDISGSSSKELTAN